MKFSSVICSSIFFIFSNCHRWKTSYVKPVHKKGSRNVVMNYRGVAILPSWSHLEWTTVSYIGSNLTSPIDFNMLSYWVASRESSVKSGILFLLLTNNWVVLLDDDSCISLYRIYPCIHINLNVSLGWIISDVKVGTNLSSSPCFLPLSLKKTILLHALLQLYVA